MAEESIRTTEFLERLLNTTSVQRFIKRYNHHMTDTPFHIYITEQCKKKGLSNAQAILNAGIDRTYGHHIFSGRKKPSRDKVLLLAFGCKMDYKETQELLRAAKKNALYPKVMRDAVIIKALQHKLPISMVQDTLNQLDLPDIDKEGRYE